MNPMPQPCITHVNDSPVPYLPRYLSSCNDHLQWLKFKRPRDRDTAKDRDEDTSEIEIEIGKCREQ